MFAELMNLKLWLQAPWGPPVITLLSALHCGWREARTQQVHTYWLGEGLRRYRACTALTLASSSSLGTTCSSSGSPLVAMTACQPL